MKFQARLKLQNSASHFTTALLQMHHDSHSWVHWTQQKFEEDPSFTCRVFREGLSTHSCCQGQGAVWNSQLGMSMRVKSLGPSHQPGKGADRLGSSQGTPQPHCQTHQVLYWHTKSGTHLERLPVRVQSQAGMGQGWGRGHLQLGWGQSQKAELKWGPL